MHGIDLNVCEGEIVTLIGANGAGKTTLLKAISGVRPITAGAIQFNGNDFSKLGPHHRVRGGIAHVPEGRHVFSSLSVEDNLKLGGWTRKASAISNECELIYEMFPVLKEKRIQQAGMLSGGQQQMLAIGRALMSQPKLLTLDEPSMGLAPILIEQVLLAVSQLRKNGVTILLVEQNVGAALKIADRAYVMETGRICLTGPAEGMLNDPRVSSSYLGI
nr:ABC transporter ATP-binding protein [Agrobacterium tumefaciens]